MTKKELEKELSEAKAMLAVAKEQDEKDFAQSEIDLLEKQLNKFGAVKADLKLASFDILKLDDFEKQQYEHHIKSMSKAEALQILINTVEGDYSQLSKDLAKIAESQDKKPKSRLGKSVKEIVEREQTGDNAIVKGKSKAEKPVTVDTEKKYKYDSKVIKHSDEHYLVLYASDTKNDAEIKFVDGQWELICKQVKDYPKFKKSEIEKAIDFVLEIKHFIATRPERQAKAKKAAERAKVNANKPESKKVEEAVEKVAESVEEKIEQLKEEGKKIPESTANSVISDVKIMVSAVKEGMKTNERKKFITKLINELKKLL
jgi:predicted transcriptional regulator